MLAQFLILLFISILLRGNSWWPATETNLSYHSTLCEGAYEINSFKSAAFLQDWTSSGNTRREKSFSVMVVESMSYEWTAPALKLLLWFLLPVFQNCLGMELLLSWFSASSQFHELSCVSNIFPTNTLFLKLARFQFCCLESVTLIDWHFKCTS